VPARFSFGQKNTAVLLQVLKVKCQGRVTSFGELVVVAPPIVVGKSLS